MIQALGLSPLEVKWLDGNFPGIGGGNATNSFRRWWRKLTEDGDVEPNPGPCRGVTINVGGQVGVWRVINSMLSQDPDRYDVVCLQEVRLGASDVDPVRGAFRRMGYRTLIQRGRETRGPEGRLQHGRPCCHSCPSPGPTSVQCVV